MPTAFSQLRAHLAAAEDGRGKGWGMLLPARARSVLKLLGLLVYSVRYVLGARLGPCDMGEMVSHG